MVSSAPEVEGIKYSPVRVPTIYPPPIRVVYSLLLKQAGLSSYQSDMTEECPLSHLKGSQRRQPLHRTLTTKNLSSKEVKYKKRKNAPTPTQPSTPERKCSPDAFGSFKDFRLMLWKRT
ncbi:hypothetical protein J6590_087428 [Homalodisca vitripennis]|nr:hypothetical protein J6590_087428 [Homalodisca vitripennis]